jgi:hypothetical protein
MDTEDRGLVVDVVASVRRMESRGSNAIANGRWRSTVAELTERDVEFSCGREVSNGSQVIY